MSARRKTADAAIVADAEAKQRGAADPVASVWVSANAGSGKTTVLVDRVARLLLAGARPHQVLCLTYTRAAAAEMLSRLARKLGEWATARDDATLDANLGGLLGRAPDDAERIAARRLFAATLDTPGGLRVQTIHAFCESILKRFPVEAGIDPGFAVADERAQAELLRNARERVLEEAGDDAALGAALDALVARVDERGLVEVLGKLIEDRQGLRRLLAAHGDDVARAVAATRARLGVAEDETAESVTAAFVAALDEVELRAAAAALAAGTKKDHEKANCLAAFLASRDRAAVVDAFLRTCLTKDLEPFDKVATQAVAKRAPAIIDSLRRLQAAMIEFVTRRNAAFVAEGTAALLVVGARLLARYDAAKRAAGLLDYDDLIRRTARLLDAEESAWVRFKLDGGVEHVLVDEAQDTSPEQWAVLDALSDEFFAGEGAGGARARTLFAVGDPKQSIFGFQGAAPDEFARMQERVRVRAEAAGHAFRAVELDASFRSTPEVLAAVDRAFAGGGVSREPVAHRAVRALDPGLVELWPLARPGPEAETEPVPWDAPVDYEAEDSPLATLATEIAKTIRSWIDSGEPLAARGRSIEAGDVMILVQRRNAFFEAMVRALKVAGVPVAGADRLALVSHIAVRDLIALGRFALLPDDELNLACLLKSPFGGLDDDDLYALCRDRPARLWPELRRRAGERPRWQRAAELLARLLARADRVAPFEFYAHALAGVDGRRALLARLGPDAADPVEEFLALALADEREHPPALEGFLDRLERGETVVKRDMEEARGEVRVMTVHAAKGLEAPIVVLPDSVRMPTGQLDGALLWEEPLVYWPVRKLHDEACCRAARAAADARRMAEHERLLYVAMTRAADRLYVCGWRGRRAPPAGGWHARVQSALEAAGAKPVPTPFGEGLRLASDSKGPERTERRSVAAAPKLPGWAARPAPPDVATKRPLAPHDALAGAEPAALRPLAPDGAWRYRRGQLIHRLLEHLPYLPPAERSAAAARFLADPGLGLDDAQQAALAREVLAVVDAPDFAPLFAPASLAEVPVVGRVGARSIVGQIDRLAVTPSEILVIDYKSNRPPPREAAGVAEAYLGQMALYRAVLASIWPGRRMRCALLWTDGPRLMELPEALLDRALSKALET